MTPETKNKGCATPFGRIAGMLISGVFAIMGAATAGHDFKASDPFPDFMAWSLFLAGAAIIPLGVGIAVSLIRAISHRRRTTRPISAVLTILFVSPVASWTTGYFVQIPHTRRSAERKHHYEVEKQAYEQFVGEIRTDPGIVLRERWFEWDSTDQEGARAEARWRTFEESFDPRQLKVPYTAVQLRRIYEESPFSREMVATHPLCPPELIEAIWPSLCNSRQMTTVQRVIRNPATPRHLLEDHVRLKPVSPAWFDHAVEQRLKRILKER